MMTNFTGKYIIGAVAGDVIGSAYEGKNRRVKAIDFPLFTDKSRFTDDSVFTFATMDNILHGLDYTAAYQRYGRTYTHRGYGSKTKEWIFSDNPEPYYSNRNGSAMRVSPVGWAYNTLKEVLAEAEKSASVSHNHPDGIKGAQAVAASVFLARSGKTKEEIKNYITNQFDYDLNRKIEDIRPDYQFSVLCSESVPESIIAFLESNSYEEAIRLAISLGGDSDTQACIAGAIAEAFYGEVPQEIIEEVIKRLRPELHNLLIQFSIKYREETKGLK